MGLTWAETSDQKPGSMAGRTGGEPTAGLTMPPRHSRGDIPFSKKTRVLKRFQNNFRVSSYATCP